MEKILFIDQKFVKKEFYIESHQHAKLAAYIFFPREVINDNIKLPVIWKHDRYHSINLENNTGGAPIDGVNYQIFIEEMIANKFIVAIVDSRGSGCSFGISDCVFSQNERHDIKLVTDWFAQQSWCNGYVGMFGRSYSGISQLFACIDPSQHLKTVIPEMALFSLYDFVYAGGIFRNDFADRWGKNVYDLDVLLPYKIPEEKNDESLVQQARQSHAKNVDIFSLFHTLPYRDSKERDNEKGFYKEYSPSSFIKEINSSNIPIFQIAGWFDLWIKDALILHNNLQQEKKLIIGPWAHGGQDNNFIIKEQVKWYRKHLYKEENREELLNQILYYTIGELAEKAWKLTNIWPLDNTTYTSYYLIEKENSSQSRLNNHLLSHQPNESLNGEANYYVDYSTSSGSTSRWANGYGGEYYYPDMNTLCEKAINFTMTPCTEDTEITGHPIVKVYISADCIDLDVFAYLFDVYPDGYVQYITEGALRISRRKLTKAPYDNFELPYFDGTAANILPLNKQEVVLLEFDLHPISYLLKKNHSIRLTFTCCDKDNFYTQIVRPNPTLTIYSNSQYQSELILPIIRN